MNSFAVAVCPECGDQVLIPVEDWILDSNKDGSTTWNAKFNYDKAECARDCNLRSFNPNDFEITGFISSE